MESHPKLGSSWEGFAMEEAIRQLGLRQNEAYFWGIHAGAELDLVFARKNRLYGVEIKFGDSPRLSPSIRSAQSELSLKHLWIVYPGPEDYNLSKEVSVISLRNISNIKL